MVVRTTPAITITKDLRIMEFIIYLTLSNIE